MLERPYVHCLAPSDWSDRPACVPFMPWVGVDYESGLGTSGKRLLVVGEAHYGTKADVEVMDECFTINQINGSWKRDAQGPWALFYRRIAELISGAPYGEWEDDDRLRVDAWRHVAFANYVPGFVGEVADTVPKSEQWNCGKTALQVILDRFAPERVLVLGLRNWNNIDMGEKVSEISAEDTEWKRRSVYQFPIDRKGGNAAHALASFVHHLSRFPIWRERGVLDALMR